MQLVPEIDGPIGSDRFLSEIVPSYRPVVLRNQMAQWPAVRAARVSDVALAEYLVPMDSGTPLSVMVGPPEIKGRFFFDDRLTGYNFQVRSGTLAGLLQHLIGQRAAVNPDTVYAGGAVARDHLPGWESDNAFPFAIGSARARIWVGNRTHVSTHMDETHNVAAVVAGRRLFTLFPPQQLDNLYVGPLHRTIAGPPVSMVDLERPDLARFPRFATALEHGLRAELAPGDALFIPALWWHDVRAETPFNVMMNYWWGEPDARSGLNALIHAMSAVRDLTPHHRAAWRYWFERYVFDDDAATMADHLPTEHRGFAGGPSPIRTAFLDAHLGKLND